MSTSFDSSFSPPPVGSKDFLSHGWEMLRDSGIPALHRSVLDSTESLRAEFMVGAGMLGLVGRRKDLKPQQLLLADVVNAGAKTVGVLLPRRSTKTTSLFALALGRCHEREDYLVGYTTCTTGQKARDRYRKDIVQVLERMFPDAASRPFKIRLAGGSERIEFDNGSIFQILPPQGENFRSDAFDLVIVDESGEASPEMSDDLIQGILPTFDTRPGAQLIVAGTAAKFRKGNLLWDTLEDGREGKGGILEFAAPDNTSADELDDWDTVKRLALAAHPGIGNLTDIETVEERWLKMKRHQFAEEYLSIFGNAAATTGIVNLEMWDRYRITGPLPKPPEKFALTIAVKPEQNAACIVAVWRDEGRAKLLVLEHWTGRYDRLVPRAAELSRKYKTPIVHDTNGPVTVAGEALRRIRPPLKLSPQSFPNVKTAAALLIKEIDIGNVDHFDQEVMNDAAKLTKKRSVGPTAWALGRSDEEHDITVMEAAAMGLRAYDDMKVRAPLQLITGMDVA